LWFEFVSLIYLKLGRPCRPLVSVRPHADALAADFVVLLFTDAVLTGIAAKMYGRMGSMVM
jgi:hypothetical protein